MPTIKKPEKIKWATTVTSEFPQKLVKVARIIRRRHPELRNVFLSQGELVEYCIDELLETTTK